MSYWALVKSKDPPPCLLLVGDGQGHAWLIVVAFIIIVEHIALFPVSQTGGMLICPKLIRTRQIRLPSHLRSLQKRHQPGAPDQLLP